MNPNQHPSASPIRFHDVESGDVCELTYEPIDIELTVDIVRDDTAGAIVTFIGTTRDTFEGRSCSIHMC